MLKICLRQGLVGHVCPPSPCRCAPCHPPGRNFMDVFCSTCLESWDTYHLRHDEIYETELAEEEIAMWLALPAANQLNTLYREAFRTVGWEFGQSLLNV